MYLVILSKGNLHVICGIQEFHDINELKLIFRNTKTHTKTHVFRFFFRVHVPCRSAQLDGLTPKRKRSSTEEAERMIFELAAGNPSFSGRNLYFILLNCKIELGHTISLKFFFQAASAR